MKKVLSKTFIRLAVSYLNVKLVKYWQEWFYDDASKLQSKQSETWITGRQKAVKTQDSALRQSPEFNTSSNDIPYLIMLRTNHILWPDPLVKLLTC